MKKKIRSCELNLPYFKQGDDFGFFLNENKGDFKKSLEDHAKMLEEAAKQLRDFSKLSETNKVISINADTHSIYLEIEDGKEVRSAIKTHLINEIEDFEDGEE